VQVDTFEVTCVLCGDLYDVPAHSELDDDRFCRVCVGTLTLDPEELVSVVRGFQKAYGCRCRGSMLLGRVPCECAEIGGAA
jgi:hypothetical protein